MFALPIVRDRPTEAHGTLVAIADSLIAYLPTRGLLQVLQGT
jgi:hypothetical protein